MKAELTSSILLVDKNSATDNILGADTAKNFDEAKKYFLQNKNYRSLILNLRDIEIDHAIQIIEINKKIIPESQIIIIRHSKVVDELQRITNKHIVFKIHENFDEQKILYDVQGALAEYDLQKQNRELIKIIEEQNSKLKSIAEDLEERVSRRSQNVIEANKLLAETNTYYQMLISAFVMIQKSDSIIELEKNILNSLSSQMNISWVRIFLENTNSFGSIKNKKNSTQTIYEKNLTLNDKNIATFALARATLNPFSKEEKKILNQISEALAIAVDRILNVEKIDLIRHQWQKTFDAIVDPVAIINSSYDVLQVNTSFSELTLKEKKFSKCYKLLFNKEKPCQGCTLGKNFTLPVEKTSSLKEREFFVTSQKLEDMSGNDLFINHYSDITNRKKAERQILESSKLSNLGLIGSSIAHELNNPLAGLITFIQILKQDLETEKETALLADISEMEKSALRCKEIIANLLSFTRSEGQEKQKLHIGDLVNKAIRVLSIKTKPLGLEIQFVNRLKNDIYLGLENNLTQAIISIIQNSIDSVMLKKRADATYTPWIEVELKEESNEFLLDIKDNGIGLGKNDHLKIFTPFFTTKNPEQHRGLGLTIAYQILRDHFATVDLTTLSENITCARISFQRPVLKS